jgi:large subunit ribosomal protein L6
MSRIGILPIDLPKGVSVTISDKNEVKVKGPKGEISQLVHQDIKVEVKDNQVIVTRPSEEIAHKSMHGLYRSLIHNMVVGYRAEAKGQVLEMSLGYSHDIHFLIPNEVKVETKQERRSNPIITLSSIDKHLLGEVAAKIRSLRPPEPYKGKGIKFVGEELRRKAGKSASV